MVTPTKESMRAGNMVSSAEGAYTVRLEGCAATTTANDDLGDGAVNNKRKVETSPQFRSARREVRGGTECAGGTRGDERSRTSAKDGRRRQQQQQSPRGQSRMVDIGRLTREVCRTLNEPKLPLMRRAIDTLGISAVESLVARVHEIEEQGGQMTAEGDRRRTPGGVFWKLLKQTVSEEEYTTIFEVERERERQRARRRQARRNQARLLGEGKIDDGASDGDGTGGGCESPSSVSDRSVDEGSSIDGRSDGAAPHLVENETGPGAEAMGRVMDAFAAPVDSTEESDGVSNVDSQHDRLVEVATSEDGDKSARGQVIGAAKGSRSSDAALRLLTPEKITDEVKELLTKDWVMVLGQSPKSSPNASMASKASSEAAGTPRGDDAAPACEREAVPLRRAKKKSGAMKIALGIAAGTPDEKAADAVAEEVGASPPRVTVEESRRTKRVTMNPDASMEAPKKKLTFADILSSP